MLRQNVCLQAVIESQAPLVLQSSSQVDWRCPGRVSDWLSFENLISAFRIQHDHRISQRTWDGPPLKRGPGRVDSCINWCDQMARHFVECFSCAQTSRLDNSVRGENRSQLGHRRLQNLRNV